MAEKHLAAAIVERFAGMSRKERVAKIRKLASASAGDEKFIRETFPDLYREAFLSPRPVAGGRSESGRPRARSGARRLAFYLRVLPTLRPSCGASHHPKLPPRPRQECLCPQIPLREQLES